MPYKKKTNRRRPRRNRQKPKARAGNFNQNTGTHVEWFKNAGDVSASPNGSIWLPTSANDIFPTPSFINECRGWEQYKVLKVIVKFYAAFVGSEGDNGTGMHRGNTITFIDQPPLQQQPQPGQISVVMGFPSAKLHQTRSTIKRWMTRPSGGRFADWAYITHPTAIGLPQVSPDAWTSRICIFGDDFSPSTQAGGRPYYFTETLYKVVFRSKYRGGPP